MFAGGLFNTIDRGLGRFVGLLLIVGSFCLIALVAVTVVAVVARYFFNDPIFGIEDISTMALTVVVAAAVAYGGQHGAHVSVNVIGFFAGRKTTRMTDILARSLGSITIGIAAYALFTKGQCGFECGAFTANLEIHHNIFYYTLGVAMALYCLQLLVHLIIGIVHFNGEDPHEIAD